ncbi:laccase-1-like [Photinus pyralis]|nr:laccase-1-like [Photinus pyralis]
MSLPLILCALLGFVWSVDGALVRSKIQAASPIKPNVESNCARQCVDGETKTCYYQFHIEHYTTMGWPCDYNSSNCIQADGVERSINTVNRMMPGPKIEVCEGDTVVVDVHNEIVGQEVTIHWHGIWQTGTPHYDGVPFVTQCPIFSGNAFRYKWKADNPGTHFWHSHTGFQKMDGISGSLIIRQTSSRDHHSSAFNNDLSEHVIVLNDWHHYLTSETFPGPMRASLIGKLPNSLLINGKGQTIHPDTGVMTQTPLEHFFVVPGETYRFRFINAMGSVCPVILTIDQHKLIAISSDGEDFDSIAVDGIQSWSAERFDFIFTANQPAASYWVRFKAVGVCQSANMQQLALVHYSSAPSVPAADPPSPESPVPQGLILNRYTKDCAEDDKDSICFNRLKTKREVDSDILKANADVKLFLPLGSYDVPATRVLKIDDKFNVFAKKKLKANRIDNIQYKSAPSPLISQYDDINPSQFCNGTHKPENCGNSCGCTHKIDLPLNSVIELILIEDSKPSFSHTIHLHGYAFNVMGIGSLPNGPGSHLDKAKWLDSNGLLQRKFDRPAFKDTLTLPVGGYVVVRFKSDNPGYWFFHCHFAHHVMTGMSLVFEVGSKEDMPRVPDHFPKCGNFLPPI